MDTRYNRAQWIESFTGQLSILRPHLSARLLDAMSNQAWHQHGTKNEEPIKAAKDWSKSLDAAKALSPVPATKTADSAPPGQVARQRRARARSR